METKVCWKCEKEKSLEDDFYKNRSTASGYHHVCKECQKAYGKARATNPATRTKVLRSLRDANCKRLYGISLDEKEKLFESQGKICKSCGSDDSQGQWCVDHNHETKEIRGIVCRPCNLILGFARDSTAHLEKAIQYLRSFLKSEGVGA
jgi:hypothetical protein